MARDCRVGVSYQHRQESTTMSPQIFILFNCEIEDKKKFQGKMHLKAECRQTDWKSFYEKHFPKTRALRRLLMDSSRY